MPLPVASFEVVYSRVVDALNAAESGTRAEWSDGAGDLDDRRREHTLIRDSIVAADLRKRKEICEDPNNPHRPAFLAYSEDLEHDDELPEMYGPPGAVIIQTHSGGSYVAGVNLVERGYTVAQGVEMIRRWRENAGSVFGSVAHDAADSPLSGFFVFFGGRIHFTGYRAQVEHATFEFDREADPPELGSPEACENDLVSDAVAYLTKEGDDQSIGSYFKGLKMTSPQP